MNIDISKIENFDELDADTLREFIKEFKYDDHTEEFMKAKKRNDELSKENADYKRKLNSATDQSKQEKAESDDKYNDLSDKYNNLVKDYEISKNASKFQKLGYTEELAHDTATAIFEGDTERVIKNQTVFQTAFEKKIREDVIKNTPKPDVKGKPKSGDLTKEEFDKMGYTERMELYTENKELYDKLNEG